MSKRLNILLLVCVLLAAPLSVLANRPDRTAVDLNDKAIAFLWNNIDSAEQYAQLALDITRRHSDEHVMAINTLARAAFMRMDYSKAWELYSSVPSMTGNMLEVVASEIGLMRICQRISNNVLFYEYRNRILQDLRALHEESAVLTEYQTERLLSLERSFRMESAQYWFELEQLSQAGHEISYVVADNSLLNDHDRYLTYLYMSGLGIGLEQGSLDELVLQRLNSLDNCLRGSVKYRNLRMQSLSTGAICALMLEFGTDMVLKDMSDDMLARLNASGVQPNLLPTQLAIKSLQLSAQFGGQYEMIEAERLLASCYLERGLYQEALGVLDRALDMLNDCYRLNSADNSQTEYLELFRNDGVIVEELWMNSLPLGVLPECMSGIREQISLAYSGLGNKEASDYNRTVYLEIQKNIRLDRRYEARTVLLERSNRRLVGMLYAVAGIILALLLLLLLFHKKINKANQRYVQLIRRTVDLCGDILVPAPKGNDELEYLNTSVAPVIMELTGAQSVNVCPDGSMDVVWSNGRISHDSRTVINTVAPFLEAAIGNAGELLGQEDRLKQADKQHYLNQKHAESSKRENLVRKTCCQVVAECLPYIDRMRAEITHLADMSQGTDQYIQSLQYVNELAARINEYSDLLSQWIRIRQGAVTLHVESFRLNELFDIVAHGNRSFIQKGIELKVIPTDSTVRADRVLTLFMINTLADNARKFTPQGGTVTISAQETKDWVEISVQDTGVGLSADDVHRISDSKVIDSDSIGRGQSSGKGSGFGLMNCKGIIEKYRKSGQMFSVCSFNVESTLGKGSLFSFRLPKGIRRVLAILALLVPAWTYSNSQEIAESQDSLLVVAYNYADKVYESNIEGRYNDALMYADSAFCALNSDYLLNGGFQDMLLSVYDTLVPAETYWLDDGFATDYETVLWLRNEIAVSALALGDWTVYRYNDNAYLKLFKLYYGEWKIEKDCRELQRTNTNLSIAVILFVIVLLSLVVVRYVMHSRNWLRFRSDLQQAIRVINGITRITAVTDLDKFNADDVVQRLANGIFPELDHLADMCTFMIVLNDEGRTITAVHSEWQADERVADRVHACLQSGSEQASADGIIRALPLVVKLDGKDRQIGAVGFQLERDPGDTWQIVQGMVVKYLALALHSCVIRFEAGFRDIEQIEEESERIKYEENRLHVSNLVLDNCLSTLKHETVWYPNRIMQMVREVEQTHSGMDSGQQIHDMLELVDYYREIFGILSQYAIRQTQDRLLHRDVLPAQDILDYASRYVEKSALRGAWNGRLRVWGSAGNIVADRVMLDYLVEILLECGMKEGGDMEFQAQTDGAFVRFTLTRTCTTPGAQELEELFTPLRNKDNMEYVICRQIIREHDESFGHPGCRINAESTPGGMAIWFTVPRQK